MEDFELDFEHVRITTDKSLLNINLIHNFLSNEASWSKNISMTKVIQSIQNSLCFGVYFQGNQIGFARVITDYSTIAYLGDIFIIENYRGRGYSKLLMEAIMTHPAYKI